MSWFKRRAHKATSGQSVPFSPETLHAIRELQTKYPVEVRQDPLAQAAHIFVQPFVGELTLSLTLGYAFPATPPDVRVADASDVYLTGLESLAHSGMIDAGTGHVQYQRCFGWHPTMQASTLVFLVCLMIRTANELSRGAEEAKGQPAGDSSSLSSPSSQSPPSSEEGSEDVIVE